MEWSNSGGAAPRSRGRPSTPITPVIATGGHVRFHGMRTTLTRRTMPKENSGASAQVSLLNGSTAEELTPEPARHGL
jgi:hypothetical protein